MEGAQNVVLNSTANIAENSQNKMNRNPLYLTIEDHEDCETIRAS